MNPDSTVPQRPTDQPSQPPKDPNMPPVDQSSQGSPSGDTGAPDEQKPDEKIGEVPPVAPNPTPGGVPTAPSDDFEVVTNPQTANVPPQPANVPPQVGTGVPPVTPNPAQGSPQATTPTPSGQLPVSQDQGEPKEESTNTEDTSSTPSTPEVPPVSDTVMPTSPIGDNSGDSQGTSTSPIGGPPAPANEPAGS